MKQLEWVYQLYYDKMNICNGFTDNKFIIYNTTNSTSWNGFTDCNKTNSNSWNGVTNYKKTNSNSWNGSQQDKFKQIAKWIIMLWMMCRLSGCL